MIDGQSGLSHLCQASAGEAGKRSKVKGNDLRRLLELQRYRCALTGWGLTPDNAACDHITPVSKQGKNSIENLQIVHRDVNAAKGVLTQEEFIDMCKAVAEHKSN